VTAAVEGVNSKKEKAIEPFKNIIDQTFQDDKHQNTEKVKEIEQRLNQLQSIIENQKKDKTNVQNEKKDDNNNQQHSVKKLIYNQLVENEVDSKIANKILDEIKLTNENQEELDSVITNVYQQIILNLGQPKTIELLKNSNKTIFFIGPTGVGKTTSIAKIASHFVINENKKVGLITADTYRIAAVEQLKTYANILCVPLKVIYTNDELNEAIKDYSDKDLILIDTAGRSHKNDEQFDDLTKLIKSIEDKEVYLVISATTKYKDLINITQKYKIATDYKIIFTECC